MFWKKGLLAIIALALLVIVGRQVAADATDATTSDTESVRRTKVADRQMAQWLERMAADESEARKDAATWDAGPKRRAKIVAGPNSNAMVTIDLITDGGAGNQMDDGVHSGNVSGQGTKIAVEVFAKGVTTALVGMKIEFDFKAEELKLDKVENSAFLYAIPEPTGVNFAATAPVTLPESGFIGRAEFSTVSDVTGQEFTLGIKAVTLAESAASFDVITTTDVITFNLMTISPIFSDFDGDGTVGNSDLSLFLSHYGTSRGDAGYDAKYDLDNNGVIGTSDFLIFSDSFGKSVPSTVAIADANLRAVIADSLGKASGAPITRAEMATLTRLDAPNKGIRSLTGLEHATNLRTLDLGDVNYQSVNSNDISDLSPLSNLTNLTWLYLSYNSVSDITPLSGLTNLLTLRLTDNSISDITSLSNLTNLTYLRLHNNSVSDITSLSNLTNLRGLYLNNNSVSDITPLSNLTNLTDLYLANNSVSDITPLSNLTNLTDLNLGGTSISDITLLSNLTNLRGLLLYNISISDITLLSNLTNLRTLFLHDNSISDITSLSNLTNLTWLTLHNNSISDITPLSNLTNLTYLGLDDNSISDISPLVANTGLGSGDTVELRNNPLSATSINTHIPALQSRGVAVEFDSGGGGGGSPDLIVDTPSVSDNTLTTRQSFTLSATVRNSGAGASASTTLRYYRSSDATISTSDTEVGTDSVNGLSASGSSDESISLSAPSSGGTYYYGACVESVGGESNTSNNCSDGVRVTVSSSGGGGGGATYGVGETLPSFPSGFFVPKRTSSASFSYSGGQAVLSFNSGGVIELQDGTTYTCISSGGCGVAGGRVTSGTIRVTGGASGDGGGGGGGGVTIADANLRAAIETSLNKASGASITRAEMATLTRLDAPNAGIRSLTGLEHATNLQWLGLGGEWVNNEWVNSNEISDLSPLSGLTNLQTLELSGNSISDISALSSLTSLTNLNLGGVRRSWGSAGVNLELDSNTISDISPLLSLTNLQSLNLSGNDISDFSPLSSLTNLTDLTLINTQISNLSYLSSLTGLTRLNLGGNTLSNLSPLRNLTRLTRLNLFVNEISDVSALSGLTNLTSLELSYNSISDISVLSNLTNLTSLELGGNSISDISVLSNLTNLTSLELGGNSISDISVLSNLTNLTSLWLGGNSLSDISALSNLTNLTYLILWDNSISDISALSNLTNLRSLYLLNNSISDLSPLVANTGLGSGDTVDLRSNPLSATSINTHIPALQSRGVTVNFDSGGGGGVTIADANLRAVIADNLGKASGAPITPAEMATLTRLDARNAGIRNLTGLEHATNLTDLDLGHVQVNGRGVNSNDISDLSPLSNLTNLTGLDLDNNSISDITALSALTNLTFLDLNSNSISDITALSALINLTQLWLDSNSISDITALSALTNLTELVLGRNSISDISALSNLTNLTRLFFDSNRTSDITALSALTNLTYLDLDNNSISDLAPLVANTGLGSGDRVDLRSNPLSATSINTHIPALQSRGVTVNFDRSSGGGGTTYGVGESLPSFPSGFFVPKRTSSASFSYSGGQAVLSFNSGGVIELQDGTTYTCISSGGCGVAGGLVTSGTIRVTGGSGGDGGGGVTIADANLRAVIADSLGKANGEAITPAEMATLTGLDAENKGIRSLTGLEHATNLQWLDLNSNDISNLSPLSGLTNLTGLGLQDNSVSDITSLSNLTNLRGLVLSGNSISDISALSGLTNLIQLNLGSNSISDITSLSGLTNLRTLGLSGNSVSDITPLSSLTNLTWLSLFLNSISDITSLSGLTNLTSLSLSNNSISDLAPLVANTGLGSGDRVNVRSNPLSATSINTHIPALQGRGVTVEFDRSSGGGSPDLIVESPSVSNNILTTGQSFTLSATVRNSGAGASASTTLRYYQSSDATISTGDTEVGTDSVNGLSASGSSSESIGLTAPSSGGTYYYGACVESVGGESNTNNNCSDGVQVTVSSSSSGNGGGTTYGVGESLPSFPSGFFVPKRTSSASFSYSGGQAVLSFNSGGVIELQDGTTYTCISSGGCGVAGGLVTSGTILVTGGSSGDGGGGGGGVTIADANLRAVIADILGKASGAPITPAEMATLTSINASNKGIRSLTGLEHATNLQWLELGIGENEVNSNDISDLSPLSNLTNLTYLNLSYNSISDILVLSNLTNLTGLWLFGNSISDISALSNLTNLTGLHLASNSISDISVLSNLTNLTWLDLSNTSISDISVLSNLTNLTGLYLSYNSISDILVLSNLTNLTELWLSDNSISDISALANLTNLTWLRLFSNSISDLAPLVANTGLGSGDEVNVLNNPLSATSINTHIPALQSRGVTVEFDSGDGGGGSPDLTVDTPSVSNNTLTTGQSFTLRATVRNSGAGASASTTLRYYRSSDATISTGDTEVGTDSVNGLSASGSSSESIGLTAPSNEGTYYYGGCVESVGGESNTNNNCSDGVQVTVSSSSSGNGGGGGGGTTYGVGESLPSFPSGFFVPKRTSSASFSYSGGRAVLSFNSGGVIELQDGTTYTCISSGGCGVAGGLVTSGTIRVTGGSSGGGGGGSPDLTVDTPSVSNNTLTTGQSFTLSATVRNSGAGASASTTLRYYRSSDATISTSDTEVGTDSVNGLSASGSSSESISLSAPSTGGTYYYGACVESVSGESNTSNNCSAGVQVTVQAAADDHSNTRSGATSLSLDSSRSGQIETGSDADYFRVQVTGSGTLTVYTTGSLDTTGELQSSSGSVLSSDDDRGSGNNFRIERSVSAGTYYIKVESYSSNTGSYTVHASFSSGGSGISGSLGRCQSGMVVSPNQSCTVSGGELINVGGGCVVYTPFGSGRICSGSFNLNGLIGTRVGSDFRIDAVP